ncbi:hypothetical protein D918_07678 [Trichuris suis]|nr:hypothetical protein D918_07678 [Trichuris suis]
MTIASVSRARMGAPVRAMGPISLAHASRDTKATIVKKRMNPAKQTPANPMGTASICPNWVPLGAIVKKATQDGYATHVMYPRNNEDMIAFFVILVVTTAAPNVADDEKDSTFLITLVALIALMCLGVAIFIQMGIRVRLIGKFNLLPPIS